MLVRANRSVYRYDITEALGKDATAEEILDYIFGDEYHCRSSNFILRVWSKDRYNRKFYHRLNMLWAMPFSLLIFPFQWVIFGHTGWSDKTKMGRFILKSTGHLFKD